MIRGLPKNAKGHTYSRFDDRPMVLDEVQNILLLEIRMYFMIQWSRHYKKYDEHQLMNRLQYMILQAIREGELPGKLNLCFHVPYKLFLSNFPIPRMYLEAHLIKVAKYLQEQNVKPGPIRYNEHKSLIEGRKPKVKKIKRKIND